MVGEKKTENKIQQNSRTFSLHTCVASNLTEIHDARGDDQIYISLPTPNHQFKKL